MEFEYREEVVSAGDQWPTDLLNEFGRHGWRFRDVYYIHGDARLLFERERTNSEDLAITVEDV